MWQALRTELHPAGLEIVTVGLDVLGAEGVRPFIERAHPDHPSLVDQAHVVDELFGIVNIPSGVWIDEHGVIVRPAEPAFPAGRPHTGGAGRGGTDGLPERMADILAEAAKIEHDADAYDAALRDWVAHGAESRYALPPDEVVARSTPRSPEVSEAAAHFELGQQLWREGDEAGAVEQFRQVHRLQPDNWTYKRQAWSMAGPKGDLFERFWQGPVEGEEWPYEGDWLSDIRAIGPEQYYKPLEL